MDRNCMDSFDAMMVALRFNEKINQRDLTGLVELMMVDHLFIVLEESPRAKTS